MNTLYEDLLHFIASLDIETYKSMLSIPMFTNILTPEIIRQYKIKFTTVIKDIDKIYYILRNKLHREDGPAIEWNNGDKEWYYHGKQHRSDGPAIETKTGTLIWYIEGLIHRDNGPAVIQSNGTKEWYKNGELHRDNGPAIEYPYGGKVWYMKNKFIGNSNME